MEIYYIILFILFLFSLLDGFRDDTISQRLFDLAILFLIVFVGIRYKVGNDYEAYHNNYIGINFGGSTDSKELIYVFLNKLLNFEGVIFFFSLFSFYYLSKSIKFFNREYANSILLVYFAIFFITFNLHIIRQGLAVAIILYSYRFYLERNYKKFVLFILLASGFHLSAFIVLPVSYFFKFELSKKKQLIILIICFILSINIGKLVDLYYTIASNIPLLNKYLLYYRRGESAQYTFSFGMLFDLLLLLLLMWRSEKFTDKQKFLYRIFFISVVLSLLLVIDEAALRMNYYFRGVAVLLLPLLYRQFRLQFLVRLIVLLVCYLYLNKGFNAIGVYGKGDRNLKYKTIFNTN